VKRRAFVSLGKSDAEATRRTAPRLRSRVNFARLKDLNETALTGEGPPGSRHLLSEIFCRSKKNKNPLRKHSAVEIYTRGDSRQEGDWGGSEKKREGIRRYKASGEEGRGYIRVVALFLSHSLPPSLFIDVRIHRVAHTSATDVYARVCLRTRRCTLYG